MVKEIPIFISGDENYAPYMAVLIASACYNTKSFLKFYIIGDPVLNFTQNQIKSMKQRFNNFDIEFLNIDMNEHFKNFRKASSFKEAPYWSNTTYARILIPQLKPELTKIINLDSDVIILGDLQDMIDIDMENYAIAGVPDNYMINECLTKCGNYLNFSEQMLQQYFNAGVLIFDCDKWRKKDITNELFRIQKKYNKNIKYVEQDLLNKYFDGNYKIISPKFNLMNSCISTLNNFPQLYKGLPYKKWNCIVRHFEGPKKPWLCKYKNANDIKSETLHFDDFWFYAAMTPFFEGLKMNFYNERFL